MIIPARLVAQPMLPQEQKVEWEKNLKDES
jgi:hypothetical protein